MIINVYEEVILVQDVKDSCLHQLWDLMQGKTITEFTSHTAAINIVQFHPNEYLLATGSSDR